MNILITGGAGYIGSVLVDHLISADHQVTVLDNFLYGQTPFGHLCYEPTFQIVRGDCRDLRLLDKLLKTADVIIPLAAIVGTPACNADIYAAQSVNYGAITSLIEHASFMHKIIIPTTNSGYGIGEHNKECTEETPLKPISLYGQTKVRAEGFVINQSKGISLRLATVFGFSPRMRTDLLINDFVYRAVKDRFVVLFEPHFRRNYIHVRDVARVFIHAIDNFDSMRGQVYNVGLSSANLTKFELCQRIQTHIPEFAFPISEVSSDPDKRDYAVSNAKIEATGWRPLWDLDAGIQELIRGYQQFGRGQYANV